MLNEQIINKAIREQDPEGEGGRLSRSSAIGNSLHYSLAAVSELADLIRLKTFLFQKFSKFISYGSFQTCKFSRLRTCTLHALGIRN